jgi:capsular polysaccharide biosynthesis protein
LIYDNLEESKESTQEASSTTNTGVISGQSSPSSRLISPLTLVYIIYAIIAGIPAAVAVIVILFRKGVI